MIRTAKLEDDLWIAKLEQETFSDPLSEEFITNDLKNNPFANYFVAEVDNQIVGYIGSWMTDNTEILNFCVSEKYRNKGIGSKLFMILEDRHIGVISLEVRESNIGAIRFYEREGFRKVAMRKNYYSNGDDAILMVKR